MFSGFRNTHFRTPPLQRGMAWGALIVLALIFFEMFNYSTTDFALHDLLGDLEFLGLRWSTILALAFCGIDFAGIARIFTPEEGKDEPAEVWYLFGAWLLAATMNAMLTWWGVSIAILNHESLGNAVIAKETLLKAVPIFVAVLVWLSRVLLIGTFSVAGNRLFSQARIPRQTGPQPASRSQAQKPLQPASAFRAASSRLPQGAGREAVSQQPGYFKPAPKPHSVPGAEPTYETVFSGQPVSTRR